MAWFGYQQWIKELTMANSGKQLNISNGQRSKPYEQCGFPRVQLSQIFGSKKTAQNSILWLICMREQCLSLFLCRPVLMQMFFGIAADATGRHCRFSECRWIFPLSASSMFLDAYWIPVKWQQALDQLDPWCHFHAKSLYRRIGRSPNYWLAMRRIHVSRRQLELQIIKNMRVTVKCLEKCFHFRK